MSRAALEAVPEYIRAELEGLRRLADLGDHYGLLGVAPDAPRPQVIQAYVDVVRKLRSYGDRYDLSAMRPGVDELLRALGASQAVLTDAIQRFQYDQKVRQRTSPGMPAVSPPRDRMTPPEPAVLSRAERAQEAWSPTAEGARGRSPSQGALPAVDATPGVVQGTAPGMRPSPPRRTPTAEFQPVPTRASNTYQVVGDRAPEREPATPPPPAPTAPFPVQRPAAPRPEAALEGAVHALDDLVRELTAWKNQTEVLLRHVDTVAAATQATLTHLQAEPSATPDRERIGRSLAALVGLRRRIGGR